MLKKTGWTICVLLIFAALGWALNHPNSVPIERVQSVELSYPIRFVVLGDTRWPGTAIFADHREQILMLDPPPLFVIDVGDLVLLGFDSEYQQYLGMIDPYPLPFVSVIGNHEMYAPGGRERYGKYFGPEDFYFDYGPLRFAAANNAVPYADYELTPSQAEWFADTLSEPGLPMAFAFLHVPLGEFVNDGLFHEALLESERVPIAFFGHEHYYERWEQDGITYVITGGGGAEIVGFREDPPYHGDFHHFCVVDVYPDGVIDVQVIRHGEGVNPDEQYSFSVQWPDFIPPIVEQTWPEDGQQDVSVASGITIAFDEPMDTGATGMALNIEPGVTGNVEWEGGGRTLVFVPEQELEHDTLYTVTIDERAADVSGNLLDGDKDGRELGEFSFSFETGKGSGSGESDDDDSSGFAGCGCGF